MFDGVVFGIVVCCCWFCGLIAIVVSCSLVVFVCRCWCRLMLLFVVVVVFVV